MTSTSKKPFKDIGKVIEEFYVGSTSRDGREERLFCVDLRRESKKGVVEFVFGATAREGRKLNGYRYGDSITTDEADMLSEHYSGDMIEKRCKSAMVVHQELTGNKEVRFLPHHPLGCMIESGTLEEITLLSGETIKLSA